MQPQNQQQIPEELAHWLVDLTIKDFIHNLKKDRVPNQKYLLKKIGADIELKVKQTQLRNDLMGDANLLIFGLCQSSKPLVLFFEKHFLDEVEKLEINSPEVNIVYFIETIQKLLVQHLVQTLPANEQGMYEQIFEAQRPTIESLVFELLDQVIRVMDESRNYIETLTKQFKEQAQPSFIMNKFLIMQLMMELSRNCYQVVSDLVEFTFFHFAEPDVIEKFLKFIIQNHDILYLKLKQINQGQNQQAKSRIALNRKQVVESCLANLNEIITQKNKPFQVYRVSYKNQKQSEYVDIEENVDSPTRQLVRLMTIREDFKQKLKQKAQKEVTLNEDNKSFQRGLYIECEDPFFRFIVFMERYSQSFKIVYAPLVSQLWTFEKTYVVERGDGQRYFNGAVKAGWLIQPIRFDNLKDLIEAPWIREQLLQIHRWKDMNFLQREELSQSKKFEGEIESMFGMFLSSITKSDNLMDFLEKYGETAVNNGSMQSLINDFPVMGDFLNQEGFGKRALLNHTSIKGPQRKVVPISRFVISTGTSLGTAVSGAILGQFLIPIPLFGSIVGGLLGGYIGNRGVTSFLKNHNRKKAKELTDKLQETQIKPDGYWATTKTILEILRINYKTFIGSVPKFYKNDINKELIWLNILVFSYLSSYHTTLQNLTNSEVKQLKKQDEDEHDQSWPESLELVQRWLLVEKINVLPCLDDMKSTLEIIIKNLG